LEYASLATYTDVNGLTGSYVGDEWGRVYQLFSGDREGIPTTTPLTTFVATVTSATSGTVVADAANFYTDGDGLVGLPVAVRSTAGEWQWRRIASNTATEITLDTVNDTTWAVTPSAGWEVVVGGIQWFHWLSWLDADRPDVMKTWGWLFVQGRATSQAHNLNVVARFNDNESVSDSATYSFTTGLLAGVWGKGKWGTSLWGSTSRRMRKSRIDRTALSVQFGFSNFYPDQPISLVSVMVTGDLSGRPVDA
jgi:hypothetical protein